MGNVTSKQKEEFRKNFDNFLKADNSKVIQTLIITIKEKADALVDTGIDPKDIKLTLWIIPKLKSPADENPNNYHTVSADYFSLDIAQLRTLVRSAVSPIYNNSYSNMLIAFYNQLVTQGSFKILFMLEYPKGSTATEHCEITIPKPEPPEPTE